MASNLRMGDFWPVIWVVMAVFTWLASPWGVQLLLAIWHGEDAGLKIDVVMGLLSFLFMSQAFVTLRQQKLRAELQCEDLKLQRDEMKATLDELLEKKEQMALKR